MVVYEIADVIAELSPFAHCVKGEDRNIRCHHCLKSGKSLGWCAKCGLVRYCSRECQTKDWKAVHQSECKVFIRAPSSEKYTLLSDTEYRLILRVILILKKFPEKEREEIRTYNGLKSFSSLVGNGEKFYNSFYSGRIRTLRRVLENAAVDIEFNKLNDIFAKVMVHFADIYIDCGEIGGQGVYIGFSGFDHSCMANSIRCPSNGVNIKIRALKRFDTRIEAPVISYFYDFLPLELRQAALDMCMIKCECLRCLFPCPAFDQEIVKRRIKFERAMGTKIYWI